MADTGCQSCLASMKSVRLLSIRARDLIPVTMKIYTAGNDGIKILGATILRFSCTSPSEASLEIRQLTYITDDSNKVFLSREARKELGMISEQFPTIGETPTTHPSAQSAITHDTTDSPIPPCKCPKRQMSPTNQLSCLLPPMKPTINTYNNGY